MVDLLVDQMAGWMALLWEKWVQPLVLWMAAQTVDLKAVMSAGLWDSQMEYLRAETKAEKLADETVCWTVVG